MCNSVKEIDDLDYDEQNEQNNSLQYQGFDVFQNEDLAIRAEIIMNGMSLEEKIGQLIIARAHIRAQRNTITSPNNIKALLEVVKPGGMIFYSRGIASTDQISKLLADIQLNSKIGMFTVLDLEGGGVNRFRGTDNFLLTDILSPKEMSELYGIREVKAYSKQIGKELKKIGFNMNFAPVVDVRYPNTARFLVNRIFANNPQHTANYGIAFMQGQQDKGIISVFKHFPGHGAGKGNTHFGSTTVNLNYRDLYRNDLLPYKQAISEGLMAVMLGHLLVPALDKKNISSQSYQTIFYLRQVLRFKGLIISDSLIMKAAKMKKGKVFEVEAIKAGIDILLDPYDPLETVKEIKRAIETGEISQERIERSVKLILAYKLYMEII